MGTYQRFAVVRLHTIGQRGAPFDSGQVLCVSVGGKIQVEMAGLVLPDAGDLRAHHEGLVGMLFGEVLQHIFCGADGLCPPEGAGKLPGSGTGDAEAVGQHRFTGLVLCGQRQKIGVVNDFRVHRQGDGDGNGAAFAGFQAAGEAVFVTNKAVFGSQTAEQGGGSIGIVL